MNKLTPKIWHAIFTSDTYDVVAQKLPTANPDMHKWAGLHSMSHYPDSPNNYWFIQEAQGYKFCLLIFELDSITAKYIDESGNDEVQDSLLFKFNTEAELYAVCEKQEVDPEKFAAPWHSNYPFR